MSTLTFNNGKTIEVLESSTISEVRGLFSAEELSEVIPEFNDKNLKNADLAGNKFLNKVYTGFRGEFQADQFLITFTFRDKSEMEIMRDKIDDIELGLMEVSDQLADMSTTEEEEA